LTAAKMYSQRGDADQVGNDDRQVEWMNAHRVCLPRRLDLAAEKWVENSGAESTRQGITER
jgi:hypothetical protein